MILYAHKVSTLLTSAAVFSSLATPSIKIFYPSSTVNLLPIFLFLIAISCVGMLRFSNGRLIVLTLWSVFFMVFSLGAMFTGFYFPTDDLIRLITLYMLGSFAALTSSYSSFNGATFYFFLWGTFLALMQLVTGINLSRDLGQHYLTLSFPIGCAAFYAARAFYVRSDPMRLRIFYAGCFFLNFAAIATLLARSPLVFAAIFAVFLVLVLIVFSGSFFSSLKVICLCVILALMSAAIFQIFPASDVFSFHQLSRFDLSSGGLGQEPRMQGFYIPALDYIQQRPLFGWGLGSSEALFGNYPHNIFLEVLTIGGLSLFIPFISIIFIFFVVIIRALRTRPLDGQIVGGIGILIYTFLQFNTSFSILSSYMLMVPLISFVSFAWRP